MRDVSCVRRRARQINRAREASGRQERRIVVRCNRMKSGFSSYSFFSATNIYLAFVERRKHYLAFVDGGDLNFRSGRNRVLGPESAPFSYTSPNFQTFLGKSPVILTIPKNGVRSRIRVQSTARKNRLGECLRGCMHVAQMRYFPNSEVRT